MYQPVFNGNEIAYIHKLYVQLGLYHAWAQGHALCDAKKESNIFLDVRQCPVPPSSAKISFD